MTDKFLGYRMQWRAAGCSGSAGILQDPGSLSLQRRLNGQVALGPPRNWVFLGKYRDP